MVAFPIPKVGPIAQQTLPVRDTAILALLLTAIAGFLDAIGYAQLHHLFVSFMSGNSTHLGMSLALHDWAAVKAAALVIGSFVMGSFLGTLVADVSPPRQIIAVLGAEFAMLATASMLGHFDNVHISLLAVATAMGMQNVLHRVVAGADIGRTFITGMLFGFGQSLARAFRSREARIQVLAFGGSWLVFFLGVVAGIIVLGHIGLALSLATMAAAIALTTLLVSLRLL